jgi:hypothetical protein
VIDGDLAMEGPVAEGTDGTEEVVFAIGMQDNHAGLTPLEKFGFLLHPGKASACYGQYSRTRVECPEIGGASDRAGAAASRSTGTEHHQSGAHNYRSAHS